MLERTDAITNEFLEPITFVLAYPTVFSAYVSSCDPPDVDQIWSKYRALDATVAETPKIAHLELLLRLSSTI